MLPVVALVCTAQFLVVANITLVTIALPTVQRDLGIAAAGSHWVITSYTLAFGGTLLLCGRLSDRFGARRVFLAGLGGFAAGSLGCGLAGNPLALLIARGGQGLGAAAVAAAALVVLIEAFPAGRDRARALGVWSAAQAAGGAAGWLIGGVVSQLLGWRWVFLGGVPLAVLAAGLAPRLLPARRRDPDARPHPPGAARLPRVLTDRSLVTGVLVLCLINALNTPVLVLCARYLQTTAGLTPAASGLLFVPFNLAVIVGSFAAARRAGRRTVTMALAVGLIGMGAAVLLLLPAAGSAFAAPLLAGFVALGLGGGAASVAATAEGAEGGPAGVASGLLNTAAELGVAIGCGTLLTVAAAAGPRTAIAAAAILAAVAATGIVLNPRDRATTRSPRRTKLVETDDAARL
jgi:MFS family permease